MTEDLTTFLLAFGSVWVGIAAYVLYLHKLQLGLDRTLRELEGKR